jgi:hypothetical protein
LQAQFFIAVAILLCYALSVLNERNIMNSEPNKPHVLLDAIREEYGLKTDAQLCRLLGLRPPVISKIRQGKHVSAETILTVQRRLSWSLSKIDKLMPPDGA